MNNHLDLLLIQDTHLDGNLSNTTQKEFKGNWEFNNRRNNSGRVTIYNKKKACRILADDSNDYNYSKGSMIGRTININDIKIYVISAYAPCVNSTTHGQQMNLDFLTQLEQLAMSKRAKGLEVLIGADLNFIRDSELDATGGDPKLYKNQLDWFNHIENDLGLVDAMRFLRPE